MKKLLIFFILVFFPSFIFAKDSIIYKKSLGNGFQLVQTEGKSSIIFNNKEIYSIKNAKEEGISMDSYYSIKNASPVNTKEKEILHYINSITESEYDEIERKNNEISKKYWVNFYILLMRWRLLWTKATNVSKYWIHLSIPTGYISYQYFVHKNTGKSIMPEPQIKSIEGKSGYYVLVYNEMVSDSTQKLYLFKDDGSVILQFENRDRWSYLVSFELLKNKKIQLNFARTQDQTFPRDGSWEKFIDIIPVKLK